MEAMIIRELKRHFPARVPEWVNAWTLVAWGVYVVLHPSLFHQTAFAGLASMAPKGVEAASFWGLVSITVGWVRVMALFVNGAYSRTPLIRLVMSLTSAFVWSQIVIGFWLTGTPSTGLVMYSSAVLMDLISAYRATCDAAIAEGTRRAAGVKKRDRPNEYGAVGGI